MTTIARQEVTFTVPANPEIQREGIPAGEHAGYVEWMTVHLHGHPKTSLGRCMLHLDRDRHPELFQNSSALSIDANITHLVAKGLVTFH